MVRLVLSLVISMEYPDEVLRINTRISADSTKVERWQTVNEFIKDGDGRVVEVISNHTITETGNDVLLDEREFSWHQLITYY